MNQIGSRAIRVECRTYVLGFTVGLISVGLLLGGCPAQSTPDTAGNNEVTGSNTVTGNQAAANALVGTWDYVGASGEVLEQNERSLKLIEFRADGTAVFGLNVYDYQIVDSSLVHLISPSETLEFEFTLNGDRLTLSGPGGTLTGQRRAD